MSTFIFEDYTFDDASSTASFLYRFDDGRRFVEKVTFSPGARPTGQVLDKALFLAFTVIGTSYFKTFPTPNVVFERGAIDEWQANFLNHVYQEGFSQFAYENKLTRSDLAHFDASVDRSAEPQSYDGDGLLVLQSGGKDSLLTSVMLDKTERDYTPWYLGSGAEYPTLLDGLGHPLVRAQRYIDMDALTTAKESGARNGHVPVTYIVQSIALIQAILLQKSTVVVSIAHEGEEPHAYIDDLPVTHQWSKTWAAEELFSDYVHRYISTDLNIGSPLRSMTELKVADLFTQHAWEKFGHSFSSCNQANYRQGADNQQLRWCGECPKCANSFLLFAPFVDSQELKSLFGDQDLFAKPLLVDTFKGLLGIDDVMKPFECVGEISELRYAYHQAQQRGGYATLPFEVPQADFDPNKVYDQQASLHLF